MKLREGMVAVGLLFGGSVFAQELVSILPVDGGGLEKVSQELITSLDQIEKIAQATQEQFWRLVPPLGNDLLYIHPDRIVRAVDWSSKAWPDSVLKQMVAEMKMVNASLYPVYRLTVVETRIGERVYYNSYDQEIWRAPAPLGYNEYRVAFEAYGVASESELSDQQKILGRSSNVGMELLLLPTVFMDSYEQDIATEEQAATLAVPLALAMSAPASVTNLMLAIGVESNEVEVGVYFPSGYTNPVDVFVSTSLMDWDWSLFTNISSIGLAEATWVDEAAPDSPAHYWVAARSDAHSDTDGIPDGQEIYLYGTLPDQSDSDGDGLSDDYEIQNNLDPLYGDSNTNGIGDLAEANLAVSMAANGSGGVLVVVPESGWYHAIDPSLNFVYLGE